MNSTQPWSNCVRRVRRVRRTAHCLLAWAILMAVISLSAQDLLIDDFEAPTYGNWVATGTAFGSGPALGTLPGQLTVTGYDGSRLVNSFLGGDVAIGALTSPPFTIQRNYIRFLIGAGNQRGKTCMNLLVNGQVVRSAVGMGDREDLSALQWNVEEFLNQTATLQISDTATGGWGHINVDQIVQTDASLGSVVTITNRYLCLPVKTGATKHLFELVMNGLVTHEFFIELADTVTPDFYAFLDLSDFQGQEALVRVDSAPATITNLNALVWSNGIVGAGTIYQEADRPIFHVTARRGWLNDPNGLVYFNGEYHLGFQHNPYGWNWANMHWAHAVSSDLVHWTELPEWLYPDPLGAAWSGSAIVDANNSAGFGTNALIAFYTGAAKGSDPNLPRMADAGKFTQCLAYSLDAGRSWVKYTNNPVVPNLVGGDNRDPKVFWYAPSNQWVMVLWLINNDYGIFSSTNLLNWFQTSTFTFPGVMEVPELFPLPLDGNPSQMQWIFWGGAGNYYLGQFDGNTFTPQTGPFTLRGGDCFAAAQTCNNIPGGTPRILIVHGTAQYPGMPFNNEINFPMNLTLQTSPAGARLYANPVPELALLRISTNLWPAQPLGDGTNVMAQTYGEAFDLDATFQPGTAASVTFNLRGTAVSYDCAGQTITCNEITQPLAPSNGVVHLQMLVDRGLVEIFGNDGLLYMPMEVAPVAGAQPVSLVASGSGARLLSLNLHGLGSAWPAAPPAMVAEPGPAATVVIGGSATFSVTAASTTLPLSYQWYNNGEAVAGATNSTLSVFAGPTTNVNYEVVVGNAGGSVTSSVAPLIVTPPWPVAYWRMEGQITAPDNAGLPTWPGIADSATNAGEGIYTTGTLPAAVDDLITFNGIGNAVTLSTNVAPASMFVNGHSAGGFSYDAAAITNVDGCLFFPQDQYGDELDFTGPFSIELFFKTDGDRGDAGVMQLVAQGSDTGQTFRYGININESAAGGIRFQVANRDLMQTNSVDLTGANYADGQWHYLLAVCDTLGGRNGQLRLTIANQDGSQASATNNLPAAFLPLPAANNGNLFIGRYSYPLNQTPRTFLGCLDEVQITAGVVPDNARIGKVPSLDNHPFIRSPVKTTNSLNLQWSGAAATNFIVQWVSQLGDVWQSIGTLPSAGSPGGFADTNASRLAVPAGFYRVLSQ
jgi:fructan beta-fructosidase